MSSVNRKLVMVLPAMLIVPSCSSRTSDIILSRNMLKSVGDRHNMHPWRTSIAIDEACFRWQSFEFLDRK